MLSKMNALNVSSQTASKSALLTVFMKAKIFSSFTLMNVLIAACVNLNAPINTKYAEIWPVITTKRDPLPDAEKYETETGKFEKYFSEKPGAGD